MWEHLNCDLWADFFKKYKSPQKIKLSPPYSIFANHFFEKYFRNDYVILGLKYDNKCGVVIGEG